VRYEDLEKARAERDVKDAKKLRYRLEKLLKRL
jgi:hypothetical protein